MECRIYLLLQGIRPYLERGVAGAESAVPTTVPSGKKTRQEQKGEEMVLRELAVITIILQKGRLKRKPASLELELVRPELRV